MWLELVSDSRCYWGFFRWLISFSEWARAPRNPSDKTPNLRKLDGGVYLTSRMSRQCLTTPPIHLPPFWSHPSSLQGRTSLTEPLQWISAFLSLKRAGHGWPESAVPRTRKTKPVTACLFFLPHQQNPTPTHPHQNYRHQTSAIHTFPCRRIYRATHTPRPHSYIPTPHTLPHHTPTNTPDRLHFLWGMSQTAAVHLLE